MSRIEKKPIEIPGGVTVEIKNGQIFVAGSKGSLSLNLPWEIEFKIADSQIQISKKNSLRKTKALQGTFYRLLLNMIKGVTTGWSKILEIVGTGYRAQILDGKLLLSLGFSHQVEVVPPPGVSFSVVEKKITVSGADKAMVGRAAARIRGLKPPDAYKGKGLRYEGEIVKLKPGKQVKVGVAGAAAPPGGK